jgi:hypothetical protein
MPNTSSYEHCSQQFGVPKVGTERIARRYNAGFQSAGYYMRDEKGRIVQDLDSYGNDTEYDSMDLMVRLDAQMVENMLI